MSRPPRLASSITRVILQVVKAAVSIPDPIFARAEAVAKKLGTSRSELYARALEAYLRELDAADMTERINEVMREVGADETRMDRALSNAQRTVLTRDDE